MEGIKINKALFIVYTPFQGICAISAIKQLGLEKYDFAIYKDFNLRQKQLETLLEKNDIKFIYIEPLSLTSFFCKLIKRHCHYDAVFIGDYYHGLTGYKQAAISLGLNSRLFYLDDGNSTFDIFSEHPRKRYSSFCNGLNYVIYYIVMKLKFIRKPYFFTMYDVKSNKFHIIKNEMSFLGGSLVSEQSGIFVIGTNATSLKMTDYHQMLSSLYSYIKKNWASEIIYYCPHRGDPASNSHIEFCRQLGMRLFNTQITIECDFIQKKITPKAIFGFGSTALYTLHKMYPNVTINNIVFHLTDSNIDAAYMEERIFFESIGVKSILLS